MLWATKDRSFFARASSKIGLHRTGLSHQVATVEQDEVDQVQGLWTSSVVPDGRDPGPGPATVRIHPARATTSSAMSARVLGNSIDGFPSYQPM